MIGGMLQGIKKGKGEEMIEVKNLSKTYITKEKKGFFGGSRVAVEAVKGLNMTIRPGEITGLLGINGAGKTTTAKMLATLLDPTSGQILYDGVDSKRHEKVIKGKVNMIAGGERMIYWRLTARENLYYFGSMYGLHGNMLKERIGHLLALVGLGEKADIPVEKFSKGMKQRLQIARGLINDPDYIFLDEPTLGLDVQIAKDMREFFMKLAKEEGKGILLTTHYMMEVEELCDYIYIMNKGELIKEGTVEDIISDSALTEAKLEDVILTMSEALKEVV